MPTKITKRQGEDYVHSYRLQTTALEKSPAFNLSEEDPLVYSQEDLEGYNPNREWPDLDLPTAAEPQALQLYLQR